MKQNKHHLIPKTLQMLFAGVLIFNLLWFVVALFMNNKAFPNPFEVYAIMPKIISSSMGGHIWASLRRVFAGTVIALILAMCGGILTAVSKRANKLLSPLLYLSYPVPKLALLPVVMILFGIGEAAKIVMIVLIIVFQLMISIRDAIRRIPKENYYVLISLGAHKRHYVRHIIIPAVLPDILSALRITVGIAISVLFVTETFGTDQGLGFFVIDQWMRLNYLAMYAGIVAISIIGFLLFCIIDIIDAVFCRWSKLRYYY